MRGVVGVLQEDGSDMEREISPRDLHALIRRQIGENMEVGTGGPEAVFLGKSDCHSAHLRTLFCVLVLTVAVQQR